MKVSVRSAFPPGQIDVVPLTVAVGFWVTVTVAVTTSSHPPTAVNVAR